MHRLLTLGLVALASSFAPAGGGSMRTAPVLPEVRQHLKDGWACLPSDPALARGHALAVLVSEDVRVEVKLDKVPANRRTACKTAVDGALEAWQKALGDTVKLERAEDGEKTDISIRFEPNVLQNGEPVAGYVNWTRRAGNGTGSVSGDVQVRFKDLDGEDMPLRAMRHIAMHEMGHLLGLDDTDHLGDVMGPLDVSHPASNPTSGEVSAVRALRGEAENLLKDAN